MDPQKDIQKTDGPIKFLDYQTLNSNPFGENRVGERVYRRAERLASAIVLLTNHISPADDLRVEARKTTLELLSAVLEIRDEMRSPNSHSANNLKMVVRKLISIVRLLGISGHVSYQNAEIVTEALDELLSFLQVSRKSNLSDSVTISREDLMDVRDHRRFLGTERKNERPTPTEEVTSGHVQPGEPAENAPSSHVSQRGSAILEVLRANGELGIRDVSANLPEYSEKMIQRELAELVVLGKVKKTGLKRWSRYTYI